MRVRREYVLEVDGVPVRAVYDDECVEGVLVPLLHRWTCMLTDDFDYQLPDELIAQAPAEPRDSCRLLVLNREDGSVEHRSFRDIVDYLDPGDLVVANKTRVMPARLVGRKRGTGGVAETLLLRRREDVDVMGHVWECLVNPGKRLKQGALVEYRPGGVHGFQADYDYQRHRSSRSSCFCLRDRGQEVPEQRHDQERR